MFFEPLIKVINSGQNLIIQLEAALMPFKLIDFIFQKDEIFSDKKKIKIKFWILLLKNIR